MKCLPLKADAKKENSCSKILLPHYLCPHPTKYSTSRPPSAHLAGGSHEPRNSAAQPNPP